MLRAVDEEIARQFRTTYRGTNHTAPSKEADIEHLIDLFTEGKLHIYCPGRVVPKTSAERVSQLASSFYSLEIHFDTEAYMNRAKGEGEHDNSVVAHEKLPDLKTAVVSYLSADYAGQQLLI